MEEAPENGKESPHSVNANGLIDGFRVFICQSLADQRIPDGRNFHATLTELFKVTGEERCRVYAA